MFPCFPQLWPTSHPTTADSARCPRLLPAARVIKKKKESLNATDVGSGCLVCASARRVRLVARGQLLTTDHQNWALRCRASTRAQPPAAVAQAKCPRESTTRGQMRAITTHAATRGNQQQSLSPPLVPITISPTAPPWPPRHGINRHQASQLPSRPESLRTARLKLLDLLERHQVVERLRMQHIMHVSPPWNMKKGTTKDAAISTVQRRLPDVCSSPCALRWAGSW